MPDEAGDQRRAQLHRRLGEIQQEIGEIRERLGPTGEEGQLAARLAAIRTEMTGIDRELASLQSPERRRRAFRVITGGAAGAAALLASGPAWASRHSRTIAASTVSAVGGAVAGTAVTVAVMGHPAAGPHTEPVPPYLSALPAPTATLDTSPSPQHTRPRGKRTPPLPPILTPASRRRSPAPAPTAPDAGPPTPPTPVGSPTPASSTTQPSPSGSCLIVLEVDRILRVCV
jgi:hypothetical protein